jgi:hypothetical protein
MSATSGQGDIGDILSLMVSAGSRKTGKYSMVTLKQKVEVRIILK